jgi:hypothetical protein
MCTVRCLHFPLGSPMWNHAHYRKFVMALKREYGHQCGITQVKRISHTESLGCPLKRSVRSPMWNHARHAYHTPKVHHSPEKGCSPEDVSKGPEKGWCCRRLVLLGLDSMKTAT